MSSLYQTLLVAVAITLLISVASIVPIAAIALRRHILKPSPKLEQTLCVIATVLVLLSSAGALTSWSLHGFWPQKTADILAYVASCALIGSAFHSSRFEILSRVAAILLAAAFLYVSCSTTSFDSMQYTETRLTPSLSLRQTYDGWVGGEWVLLRIVYRPS